MNGSCTGVFGAHARTQPRASSPCIRMYAPNRPSATAAGPVPSFGIPPMSIHARVAPGPKRCASRPSVHDQHAVPAGRIVAFRKSRRGISGCRGNRPRVPVSQHLRGRCAVGRRHRAARAGHGGVRQGAEQRDCGHAPRALQRQRGAMGCRCGQSSRDVRAAVDSLARHTLRQPRCLPDGNRTGTRGILRIAPARQPWRRRFFRRRRAAH